MEKLEIKGRETPSPEERNKSMEPHEFIVDVRKESELKDALVIKALAKTIRLLNEGSYCQIEHI